MRHVLLVAIVLLLGAGIATATAGDQGRRLAGPFCVGAKTGVVRSVAATKKCKRGELRKVGLALPAAIGAKGVAGPIGPKGDQGAAGPAGPVGPAGEKGAQGNPGHDGAEGKDGAAGKQGEPGKSAYEVWLDAGHTGTVADFLNWIRGKDGANGKDGKNGANGTDGAPGQNGHPGENGAPGLSAYQQWLADGHTGTVGDFMKSLKGEKGDQGPPVSTETGEMCVNRHDHQIGWGACEPGNGGTTVTVFLQP